MLDDAWVYRYARGKTFEQWNSLIHRERVYLLSSADILFDGNYKVLFRPLSSLLVHFNTVRCSKSTIGIHIRRTDNENAIRYSPTSLFIKRVQQEILIDPEVTFYLATDDPKEEDTFMSFFVTEYLFIRSIASIGKVLLQQKML